jgi:hypothetical protein
MKSYFRILFLLGVFLIFGTGCQVFHKQHRSRGVIIESRPAGRKSVEKEKKILAKKDARLSYHGKTKKHRKRE